MTWLTGDLLTGDLTNRRLYQLFSRGTSPTSGLTLPSGDLASLRGDFTYKGLQQHVTLLNVECLYLTLCRSEPIQYTRYPQPLCHLHWLSMQMGNIVTARWFDALTTACDSHQAPDVFIFCQSIWFIGMKREFQIWPWTWPNMVDLALCLANTNCIVTETWKVMKYLYSDIFISGA